ncbi:MAG: hypothetical protein GQ564_16265 [Bacteroidales bacterium]|nr:hypothetical protein [Bacteroidales bacterium]
MEEYKARNTSQGLGIAGFVLGILALIISFIPCIGILALVPGILAVTLSAIGYLQATKLNTSKGIIIAALIISILGCGNAFRVYKNTAPHIEKFGKEIQKAIDEELDEGNMEELERAMEKLEGEIEEITDETLKDVSDAASDAIREIAEEVEKAADELDDIDDDE